MHFRFVPELLVGIYLPRDAPTLMGRQWAQGRQIQEVVRESMGQLCLDYAYIRWPSSPNLIQPAGSFSAGSSEAAISIKGQPLP